MRFLSIIFTMAIIAMLIVSANAQEHATHHPDQTATVQTDTSGGMGMMQGMMQGGMMGPQGMHAQCMNKMMNVGMMGGQGMMGGNGMMRGGMMGNMMGMMHGQGMMGHHNPMHHYTHLIYHLPDMKVKLKLSEDQVNRLKTVQADFLKRRADWNAAIDKKEVDLNLMLDKNAAPGDVEKILKSIYDVKVAMKVASYETAQKMKTVLSPDQLGKLDDSLSMCTGQGMMGMMGGQM